MKGQLPEGVATYCASTRALDLITPSDRPLRLLPPIRCAYSTFSWASHVATTSNISLSAQSPPPLPSIPDMIQSLGRSVPELIPELTPSPPLPWSIPKPTSVASCGATVFVLDPTLSDHFFASVLPSHYPERLLCLTFEEDRKRGGSEYRLHYIPLIVRGAARHRRATEALVLRLRGSDEWMCAVAAQVTASWLSNPTNVVLRVCGRVGSKEKVRLAVWRALAENDGISGIEGEGVGGGRCGLLSIVVKCD